jgi:hypothetical protein
MSSHHSNFHFQITIQNFNLARAAMSVLVNYKGAVMDMNENEGGLRVRLISRLRVITIGSVLALAALAPLEGSAYTLLPLLEGKIVAVAVNGGADTVNPGTTCIRVDVPLDAAAVCGAGWIAITNNNSKLVNAALSARALNRPMSLIYVTDSANQMHCPWLAITPCSVVSIVVK